MNNSHAGLIQLMSLMEGQFANNDLQQLCFQLGVDYEDIPGPNRQAKIRELIQHMNRHTRVCELVEAVGKVRPKSRNRLNKIAPLLDCPTIEVKEEEEGKVATDKHAGLSYKLDEPDKPTLSQESATKAQAFQEEKRPSPTQNTNLKIVYRAGILSPAVITILQTIFTSHTRLIIRSEFGTGLSGSRVFLVRPIRPDNAAELPAVVKVDRAAAIKREWQAYHDCIERRLPDVAEIRGEPLYDPEQVWGALWYPLAGDGTFDIQSFYDYYQAAQTSDVQYVLTERLGRSLTQLWQQSHQEWDFHVGTFYDSFLPMNLVIDCRGEQETAASPISLTPQNATFNRLQTGDPVQISGFRIARVFAEQSRLSLDMPRHQASAYRMAVYIDSVANYEEGQMLSGTLRGVVTKMRHELLQEQAQKAMGDEVDVTAVPLHTPKGQYLPNPLTTLPTILNQTFDTRLACLHGDLNLQNILVEPQSRTVRLIDFAKSGRNHVMRDLICLEMNIVVRLLPPALAEAGLVPEDIVGFYEKLHCALQRPHNTITSPSGLEKPFAVIHSLRQQARPYLFTADKWDEYYYGLFIYFLGALKFGDLDLLPAAPWPKQLAFYGAAAVQKLLDTGDKICEETAATPATSTTTAQSPQPTSTRSTYTDSFTAYERGLQNLLDQLGSSHPNYADALLYQQRLSENIQRTRRFGDTASRRADRAEIIDQLNALALNTLQKSFNDLCS